MDTPQPPRIELKLGSSSFTISPERHALASLRARYAEVALRRKAEFELDYSHFVGADELFQELPDRVQQTIKDTASLVANDIAAQGIYDLDLETC
jgi:hypothetical protein